MACWPKFPGIISRSMKTPGTSFIGEIGARPGLIMPGQPRVGHKFYQEVAPGVAMDRTEITSLAETLKTPAGTLARCLKTKEGTPLNLQELEFKTYAPGIGLVQDGDALLAEYGWRSAAQ